MMREPRSRISFALPFALVCAGAVSLFTVDGDGDAGVALGPRVANASVAIAASLDDLARASSVIARVTPIERASAWEDGRIVTTTRVRVDEIIAGSLAGPSGARELRVRTLGGRVDAIGQIVEGEASLSPSEPSIVFLTPLPGPVVDPAFFVVGRAQGQLLVKRDARGREIVRLGAMGELVDRRVRPPLQNGGQRITELDGAVVSSVVSAARRAWEVGHAK